MEAFDLQAVDYVLKPVRAAGSPRPYAGWCTAATGPRRRPGVQIPVERGGRDQVRRPRDVRYVEAHGDYARLHTSSDTYLIRTPLSSLEEE